MAEQMKSSLASVTGDREKFLVSRGMKVTRSRMLLLELLQSHANRQEHVSAEQLYRDLVAGGKPVGLATIYRVLGMFEAHGIVRREQFARGQTVYELLSERDAHHHMIKPDGTPVMEFSDAALERRLRKIAEQNGYQYLGSELIVRVGIATPGVSV